MTEPALALALELSETGIQMRAQRFRREHPDASDTEVDSFMRAWLHDRPGAPDGDSSGHRVELQRVS